MDREIKIFPPEKASAMFARLGELSYDLDSVRRKFPDCPYGEDARQKLDIFLPNEGEGPFPIIFFLHGGGWAGGRKDDTQRVPFLYGLERGYAVVSIGYRLVPKIRYPENLFDVKAALRWVAENGENYLLDSDRAALTGQSAGAHLAMLAAFTHGQAGFEGAPLGKTCTIRGVINQYGPTDFLRSHAQYDESGYPRATPPDDPGPSGFDHMLGARAAEIPGLLHFCTPMALIHRDVPPLLAQHGRPDPIVPYQQSTKLVEAINALAPGRAELDLYDDYLHADPGFASPESLGRIFAFLDKHVK